MYHPMASGVPGQLHQSSLHRQRCPQAQFVGSSARPFFCRHFFCKRNPSNDVSAYTQWSHVTRKIYGRHVNNNHEKGHIKFSRIKPRVEVFLVRFGRVPKVQVDDF